MEKLFCEAERLKKKKLELEMEERKKELERKKKKEEKTKRVKEKKKRMKEISCFLKKQKKEDEKARRISEEQQNYVDGLAHDLVIKYKNDLHLLDSDEKSEKMTKYMNSVSRKIWN